jgi:hypothetical protein
VIASFVPCPFCASPRVYFLTKGAPEDPTIAIVCAVCGAWGPHCPDPATARERWECRKTPPPAAAANPQKVSIPVSHKTPRRESRVKRHPGGPRRG